MTYTHRGETSKKVLLLLVVFLLSLFPAKAQVESLTPEWHAIMTARIIATDWVQAIYGEPVDCFNYGDAMLRRGVIAYCYEVESESLYLHRTMLNWLIPNSEGANFISDWIYETDSQGKLVGLGAYRLFTYDPLPGHVFTVYVLPGNEGSSIGMVTGLPPGFI